jgi:hypothetical protein
MKYLIVCLSLLAIPSLVLGFDWPVLVIQNPNECKAALYLRVKVFRFSGF